MVQEEAASALNKPAGQLRERVRSRGRLVVLRWLCQK